jgi:RES domain-containing protein
MIVTRICKRRYGVLDGTGAGFWGGRWNSVGRAVVYASTCQGGGLLELLVHRGRTRISGAHHVGEILIPEDQPVERLDPEALPGWEDPESPAARAYGDAWFGQRRSLALMVPSVPGWPLQQNVLLNPLHPGFERVTLVRVLNLPWDARLFPRS